METKSNTADSLGLLRPKILVVVDNEQVRTSVEEVLEFYQFQIATAANVDEAIHLINAEFFDALLSDWRTIEVEGGFVVFSVLRQRNPDALTLVYKGFSELKEALDAIQLQSNKAACSAPTEPMFGKAENRDTRQPTHMEQVAALVGQNVFGTMMDWLDRVDCDDELTRIPLSTAERIGQLPRLLWGLAQSLRSPRMPGKRAGSEAATEQGILRFLTRSSKGTTQERKFQSWSAEPHRIPASKSV